MKRTYGILVATVFLFGCEKYVLDEKVKELCAKDGGITVYEAVKLPAEKFDRNGRLSIPLKEDAKPSDHFYYEWKVTYLKEGNPSMRRDVFRVIRSSDGKVLGEDVSYARRGGDAPGPWHESSFRCPGSANHPSLESSVFLKDGVK